VVVVDTSLAVPWVLPEVTTPGAVALLARWQRDAVERLAPTLFVSEVNGAHIRRRRRNEITAGDAALASTELLRAVRLSPDDARLAPRALTIADQLGASPYDALYAALAEREGCELWTGDKRFFNAAHGRYPWVRWVGEPL
jgi:predicted nucleic acid-binding protein